MITLDVSSPHCCTLVALIGALKGAGVQAQVTETLSTVPYREVLGAQEELDIEAGFHILIFNVQPAEFRFKVWGPLTGLMPVECGTWRPPSTRGACRIGLVACLCRAGARTLG